MDLDRPGYLQSERPRLLREKTDLETDGDVTRQLARGGDYGLATLLCKEHFTLRQGFGEVFEALFPSLQAQTIPKRGKTHEDIFIVWMS